MFKFSTILRTFLLVAIVGVGAYWYVSDSLQNFPNLEIGSYQGVVTGLGNDKSKANALYIERLEKPDRLLFVVFADGWQPEMVALSESKSKVKLGADSIYAPVTVSQGNDSYTFFGKRNAEGFSGSFRGSAGVEGEWAIKPNRSTLEKTAVSSNEVPDFTHWLTLKRQYLIFHSRVNSLKEARRAFVENHDHFAALLQDQETLKRRATEKKTALEKQLQDTMTLREDLGSQIDTLLSKLSLLSRITNRGKAVDLARKVAKREQKWYLANWGQEEPLEIESLIARDLDVDVGALSGQLRRAEEINRLQLEIDQEKQRIEELSGERNKPTNPDENLPPAKKDERSVWKLLFG